MNFCINRGRLVGGRGAIPEAPFDFVWPGIGPSFGCNSLVCEECRQPVKNQPGLRLAHPLSAEEQQRLAGAEVWSELVGDLVSREEDSRVYACACASVTIDRERNVGDDDCQPNMDRPLPAGWGCAGHPLLELPATIDGLTVAEGGPLEPLAAAALRGELATPAPFDSYPAAWLQRLFHLVGHTSLSHALSRAVAASLACDDFAEYSSAVDFFFLLPNAPGGHALAEMPFERLEKSLDRRVDFRKSLPFGELFQFALAGQMRPASEPSGNVIQAARRAVLWPVAGASRLYSGLAAHDRQWFLSNASDIAAAHPTRLHMDALARQLAKCESSS